MSTTSRPLGHILGLMCVCSLYTRTPSPHGNIIPIMWLFQSTLSSPLNQLDNNNLIQQLPSPIFQPMPCNQQPQLSSLAGLGFFNILTICTIQWITSSVLYTYATHQKHGGSLHQLGHEKTSWHYFHALHHSSTSAHFF